MFVNFTNEKINNNKYIQLGVLISIVLDNKTRGTMYKQIMLTLLVLSNTTKINTYL